MVGILQRRSALILVLMLSTSRAHSLDNPDAPDLVADFAVRTERYEANIDKHAGEVAGLASLYADYEKFLDQELNKDYAQLLNKMSDPGRQEFIHAQRNWVAFRDAEFSFIAANWTREQFGESYVLSRGQYRSSLIKERVLRILYYMRNY